MNIGKKIISAFVEVQEDAVSTPETKNSEARVSQAPITENSGKFREHFISVMKSANLPGPDFFEFSTMVDAMKMIPDEKARYIAAFAGLHVQGLTLEKLTGSASQYLTVLEEDAANFRKSLNQAEIDKVNRIKLELQANRDRIQALTEQIRQLHEEIRKMEAELQENEAKLAQNAHGYESELGQTRNHIRETVRKIAVYLDKQ